MRLLKAKLKNTNNIRTKTNYHMDLYITSQTILILENEIIKVFNTQTMTITFQKNQPFIHILDETYRKYNRDKILEVWQK